MGKVIIGIRNENGKVECKSQTIGDNVPELALALAMLELQKNKILKQIIKMSDVKEDVPP